MPIYEYKCEKCGHRFDVLQRIGQNGDELVCPECGAPKPQKQISSFASSFGDGYVSGGGNSSSSCGSFG